MLNSSSKLNMSSSLKSGKRRRVRIGRCVLLMIVLSVLLYGGVRAYKSGSGDVLLVDRISVIGARVIPESKIIALSGIRVGTDMRRVSPDLISAKLLSHSKYLRKVRVDKGLSGQVIIRVWERRPEAVLRSRGRYYLVDDEGFVLEEDVSPDKYRGFKVIEGDVKIALATMRYIEMLYPVLFEKVKLISAEKPSRIVVRLKDGTRVLLRSGNIEEGLENAYLIDSMRRCQGESGGYIDARYDKLVYCGGT